MSPPDPSSESRRLAALRRSRLMGSGPDATLDCLVTLIAREFGVGVTMVNLVDDRQQWSKAAFGHPGGSVPLDESFCVRITRTHRPLIVPDTSQVASLKDHPAVVGPANIQFYMGVPLRDAGGEVLGALCIADVTPRQVDDLMVARLQSYVGVVEAILEQSQLTRAMASALSTFDHSPLIVVATTHSGRVRYANRLAFTEYGLSHSDPGMPLDPLGPLTFLTAEQEAACRAAITSGHTWKGEVRRDRRVLEVRLNPTRDANGQHTGTSYVLRDVTEERHVETLKQRLFAESGETLQLLDARGTIVYDTRGPDRSGQHFSLSPEWRHRHAQDTPSLHAALEAEVRTRNREVVWRYQLPGEPLQWVRTKAAAVLDEHGVLTHTLLVHQYVTEHMEAEQQRQVLEAAIRAASEPIMVTRVGEYSGGNLDLTVIFANEAFTDLTGYSNNELMGRHPEFLYRSRPAVLRRIYAQVSRGEVVHLTTRLPGRTGQPRWLRATVSPVMDRQGRVMFLLVIAQDITRERRVRQRDEARRRALELSVMGAPLADVLREVTREVTRVLPGVSASVWQRDGDQLKLCAQHGPVPAVVWEIPVNTDTPSARVTRTGHPSFQPGGPAVSLPELDLLSSAPGCWSQPILGQEGAVLGAVSVYPQQQQLTIPDPVETLKDAARLAAVLINRDAAQQATRHLALHDALTDLPNRAEFTRLLQEALQGLPGGQSLAVGFLDLNRFKAVNDLFGHAAGDQLLRECARRLRHAVSEAGHVARMGGDEFTVIFPRVASREELPRLAAQVLSAFEDDFRIEGQDLYVQASLGFALARTADADIPTLLQQADVAMYHAKHHRLPWATYSSRLHPADPADVTVTSSLHRAHLNSELELHYQPIIGPRGQVVEVEALMRWPGGPPGSRSPDVFIPAAEESGLIVPLGEWALHAACRDAAALQSTAPGVRVAVNVSVRQFQQPDFEQVVQAALLGSGLAPELLTLELTEGVLVEAHDTLLKLCRLRSAGVRLVVDDFGTGYSSLQYIKRLPITGVKVDRSFMEGLHADLNGADAHILHAAAQVCRGLRLELVLEGIETPAQDLFVRQFGPAGRQGWLYGAAMPPGQLGAWIHGFAADDHSSLL
ncbi:EAL domain-containing protein [Deinococcus sp. 6YEL10]|uniref:EAL domain-containing protein n=1 Tax=Deinococcus sp. 6YEL10 TaxID=2745870 RepID=UPI001E440857|nr:EAL domain-containing protein [Deinococcus sp. 6YEL10]MCD0160898.1 EAL domain-containing protein [Deinococcus sp. 6YEL10]